VAGRPAGGIELPWPAVNRICNDQSRISKLNEIADSGVEQQELVVPIADRGAEPGGREIAVDPIGLGRRAGRAARPRCSVGVR
jgi:hypothetical protein